MNKRVKTAWLVALRSGDFKQGTGTLKHVSKTGNVKHCCLGVLCELHAKVKKKKWITRHPEAIAPNGATSPSYLNEAATLPLAVMAWAGLTDCNPEIDGTPLAALNDGRSKFPVLRRKTFKQIAKLIEEKL